MQINCYVLLNLKQGESTDLWGRQNTSFNGCKTLINPYTKFLGIRILRVGIVMNSLIK